MTMQENKYLTKKQIRFNNILLIFWGIALFILSPFVLAVHICYKVFKIDEKWKWINMLNVNVGILTKKKRKIVTDVENDYIINRGRKDEQRKKL